jgi:hypothetical protein
MKSVAAAPLLPLVVAVVGVVLFSSCPLSTAAAAAHAKYRPNLGDVCQESAGGVEALTRALTLRADANRNVVVAMSNGAKVGGLYKLNAVRPIACNRLVSFNP